MKTSAYAEPVAPEEPLGFSGQELAVVDTCKFRAGNGQTSPVTLIAGVYACVLSFRASSPFELWTEKAQTPLVSFDGQRLFIAPAIQGVVNDIDAICAAEQQVGRRVRAQEPREETPSEGSPAVAPSTNNETAPGNRRRR